jgi:hypothetical protein
MYYCNSRYYNPEWGRFLNADDNLGNPGELLTHNLFAYCANNPVMYVDPDGHFFMLVTGAIGLVAGAAIGGVIAAKTGKNVWAGIGIGAVAGGAIGLTCGAAAAVIATGSATASTGAVLTGMGVGVASGGTVVIGETMRRVCSYADNIGAKTYSGLINYSQLEDRFGTKIANFLGKVDNAKWLLQQMSTNTKIVDIGIDMDRASRSSSYLMERILSFFYQNKEIVNKLVK